MMFFFLKRHRSRLLDALDARPLAHRLQEDVDQSLLEGTRLGGGERICELADGPAGLRLHSRMCPAGPHALADVLQQAQLKGLLTWPHC